MTQVIQKIWERQFFLTTVGLIAALALLIAFIAQYSFGIIPCPLCLYERYVYAGIAIVGLGSLFCDRSVLFYVMIFLIIGGLGLGIYHLGVESLWWKAPSSCTGATISASNFEDFQAQFMAKSAPRCDRIGWVIFGISATIWNVLLFFSFGLYAFISKIKSSLPPS